MQQRITRLGDGKHKMKSTYNIPFELTNDWQSQRFNVGFKKLHQEMSSGNKSVHGYTLLCVWSVKKYIVPSNLHTTQKDKGQREPHDQHLYGLLGIIKTVKWLSICSISIWTRTLNLTPGYLPIPPHLSLPHGKKTLQNITQATTK